MKRIFKSESGSALLLALVGCALIGATITASLIINTAQSQQLSEQRLKNNAFNVRQSLFAQIGDQSTWRSTVANNASMSCLQAGNCVAGNPPTQTSSNFTLYDSAGNVSYNPMNPAAGFDFAGSSCNTYTPAGNDKCPLRVDLWWYPSCANATNPGSCATPEEMVAVQFTYSPASPALKFAFNPTNYSATMSRLLMGSNTPILRCAEKQMAYVGNFPGSVNGFGGYSSDAAGCIPWAAFLGPRGPIIPPPPPPPPPSGATWALYPTAVPLLVGLCPFFPSNIAPADHTVPCAGYEGQFCNSAMAYYKCQ